MSSNTATWGRSWNGAQPQRINPVQSPSSQQHGGRRSLLERLRTDTPHKNQRRSDTAAQEPQYVDVTAAFFARHRRQAPQVKHSAPIHGAPVRPGLLFSEKGQQRQQKHRSPLQEPQTPKSPLAEELKKNIATEGELLYSNGSDRLNDMYKTLKGIMANAGMENDRALAVIEAHHKKIVKPLSDTKLVETLTNEHDEPTSRCELRIGTGVASIRERIQALESEVGQLWEDWEAAELEVQAILASVTESGDYGLTSPIKHAQESLALEMESFDEELVRIVEESHEAAKMSEKEFSKKINGVMNALLQQYLMDD